MQQNGTNATIDDAKQALAQAKDALAQATKDGKATGDAAWKISSAQDAFARGDYAASLQLSNDALALAKAAKPAASLPYMPPVVAQAAKENAIPLATMALVAGAIVIAGAGMLLYLRRKKKKSK